MFGKVKNKNTDIGKEDPRIAELETQMAQLKEKLKESEAELETVNNCTHLGIWKCFYDEAGNQAAVEYTDEFRRMLGYSRSELPDAIEALGKIIHQDDAPAVFADFAAAAGDKSGKKKFDIDYRLLTKSGEYKWTRS